LAPICNRQEEKMTAPSKTIFHYMRGLNAMMTNNYKRGIGPTRVVLLLTTTGRKSGLLRVTPLQYEQVDDDYYIASARGTQADWFKNVVSDPKVHVQIKQQEFDALAEPITDPNRIADFIEMRLQRHPVMIRLIIHLFDGLPLKYSRADLESFCKEKAMVILRKVDDQQLNLEP
jgi:deazaflavin-dependent oxidoreductase (nitroreductase family)